MYSEFIGSRVTLIICTRTENLMEYKGILSSENEENVVLEDASISCMMFNIQKSFFGDGVSKYKENVEKVIVNKSYIISCDK